MACRYVSPHTSLELSGGPVQDRVLPPVAPSVLAPRGSPYQRTAALIEVFLVFTLTHVAYRALKRFSLLGEWEQGAGTNFLPGAVFASITVTRIFLGRLRFGAFGLSLQTWKRDLSLGLACSLMLLALAAAALTITGASYDPDRPPDPNGPFPWMRLLGALLLGSAGMGIGVGLLRRKELLAKTPPAVTVPLLGGLFATPILVGLCFHRAEIGLTALWLFFGAGLGEELFFRGYIQSRIDQAFGKPYQVGVCRFGPGLWISAILFGWIHALNTVDYFEGRWHFGWGYGLQNIFVGLLYGALRAAAGTIWPGVLIHGLLDLWGIVPKLVRGA